MRIVELSSSRSPKRRDFFTKDWFDSIVRKTSIVSETAGKSDPATTCRVVSMEVKGKKNNCVFFLNVHSSEKYFGTKKVFNWKTKNIV